MTGAPHIEKPGKRAESIQENTALISRDNGVTRGAILRTALISILLLAVGSVNDDRRGDSRVMPCPNLFVRLFQVSVLVPCMYYFLDASHFTTSFAFESGGKTG